MAAKSRKGLADQERLKTLAFKEDIAKRGKGRFNNRVVFVVAALWALAAAFPSAYIGRPIPFMVGSIATYDIYSRTDFRWRDPQAEAQALKNLESSFARHYREESFSAWAAATYGPVEQLLIRAAGAADLSEVEQAAKEVGVSATRDQLAVLWRGAMVAKNDPYHYLVSPLKEILDNEVFPLGILNPDRYEIERGRTIQIQRGDSVLSAMVGGERGPVTPVQLAIPLERRFQVKLSTWIPDDFKVSLREIVLKRLRPSLVYDEAGSRAGLDERRQDLLSKVQTVGRNDVLLARGEPVTLDKVAMLREEDSVYQAKQGWRQSATRAAGNLVLFAAIGLAMVIYFRTYESKRPGTLKRYFTMFLLSLVIVYTGYALIYFGFPGTMFPVGLAVGVVAFGMNAQSAVFLAAITSLSSLILFEGRPDIMVGHFAASLFFINAAVRCRWRFTLIVMFILSGVIGAVSFIAWNFARGNFQGLILVFSDWRQSIADSSFPIMAAGGLLANWVICCFLILLFLPAIERFFGVTTRIHLQDLSSQEHPLLRRLILEAPGTYHHSSIVSTLAEAGASAIGADGLRARIGGLFHDIGKLLKPEYFTENEFGVSRHEKMSPNMSALLIINHVRDGAEMARTFGLPNAVVDMILQHHGDALMKFFYNKVAQQAPAGTAIAKEPFTYPGPKPQTPEAGVLMIADSVEAAVRSLDNPSSQHLKDLLARLIRERLVDGLFEESGLTMRQLAQIEEVLYRMLVSMYHTRVKYPGQEKEKGGRKR